MTQGRCGSLLHIRMTLSFTTPRRFTRRTGEPGYENRFRSRPISGGRDLSCYGAERLPALHSLSPASGCCWSVHGCPLCLALPVGDLRVSGHRRCTSAAQPLRTVGGGNAGTGDCQHSYFPYLDGPKRASAGPFRICTVGRGLHRRATGLFRVVPVAVATAGLIAVLTAKERKPKHGAKTHSRCYGIHG